MPDPVSNVEIEDVLSSIRKLVAEESRTSPPVHKPRAEVSRLVLTPAQRVDEVHTETDDAAPKPDKPPAPPRHPLAVEERAIDDIPGNARLADFGEVEGDFPDIEDVEASTKPEPALVLKTPAPAEKAEPKSTLAEIVEEEVSAVLGISDPLPDGQTVSERAGLIEDDEDAVDWNSLVSEPDDADFRDIEEPVIDDISEVEDNATPDSRVFEAPTKTAELSTGTPETLTEEAQPEPPMTLEAKVAALGRLVARDNGEFEEDREAANTQAIDVRSEPMRWSAPEEDAQLSSDAVNVEIDAPVLDETATEESIPSDVTPRAETVESITEPATVVFDETHPETDQSLTEPVAEIGHLQKGLEDTTAETPVAAQIDQDALRQMVVDIVRSELQGAMGERITRNVRKLVRREIHRMLISQELE